MTKDRYDSLSANEKLMYDEMADFSKKLLDRIDVLTDAVKKLIDLASTDPE